MGTRKILPMLLLTILLVVSPLPLDASASYSEQAAEVGIPRIAIIVPNYTTIGVSSLFHILSSILARAGLCSYVNYTAVADGALNKFDVAILASLGGTYDNGYVPETVLKKLVEFNRRGNGVLVLGKPAILLPNGSFSGDFHPDIYVITETPAYWAFPDTNVVYFYGTHALLSGVPYEKWTMPTVPDFFLDIYSAPTYVQPIIVFDTLWRGYPAVAAAAVDPPDRGRVFISVYAPKSRSDPLPFLSKRFWWNIVRWVAKLDTSVYIELPVFLEIEKLLVHSGAVALRFDDRAEEHLEAVLKAGYPATLLLISTFLKTEPWLNRYTRILWKDYELELADHTFSHCGDAELLLQGYGSIENGTYLEIIHNIESCRSEFQITPVLFAPPGGAAALYMKSAYRCSPPIITSLSISAYYPTQLYGLPVLACPGGRIRDDWSYERWLREVRLSVRVDRLISSELHPALTIPRIGELLRLLSWIRSEYPDMLFTTLGRENLIRYEQYAIEHLTGVFNGTHFILDMNLSRTAYCLTLRFPNITLRSVSVDGYPIYTFSDHVALLPVLQPGHHVIVASAFDPTVPHVNGVYVKHPYLPVFHYTSWNGSHLSIVVSKDERWILNESWPAQISIATEGYAPTQVLGANAWRYDPVHEKLVLDLSLTNKTILGVRFKPVEPTLIQVVNKDGQPLTLCRVSVSVYSSTVSTCTNTSGYAYLGHLPNTTVLLYIEGSSYSIEAGMHQICVNVPYGCLIIRGRCPPLSVLLWRGKNSSFVISYTTELHLRLPTDNYSYLITDGTGLRVSGMLRIQPNSVATVFLESPETVKLRPYVLGELLALVALGGCLYYATKKSRS